MSLQSSLNVVENVGYTYIVRNNNLLHNYFFINYCSEMFWLQVFAGFRELVVTSMFRSCK